MWPIFYFGPFDKDPMWLWKRQRRLDGWQNRIGFVVGFAAAILMAVRTGHSVVGVFNRRADRAVVEVFQRWVAAGRKRWER